MSRFSLRLALLLATFSCVTPATADMGPPAGSAAALGQHPRMFFTQGELPALRQRLAVHYKDQLQEFIDGLNDLSWLNRRQREIEANWGGLNYAFLAVLDPAQMSALGLKFSAPLDTPRGYCDRAMQYTRELLPGIAAAKSQSGGTLATGYPSPLYVSALTTYDWCYSHLTEPERREIVDAYIANYQKKYAGKNPLTMQIYSLNMLANDRETNKVEDIVGIVAFYGDAYPARALQEEMYHTFHEIWFNRYFVELEHFYGHGTNWHEGPGGYMYNALVSLAYSVGAFDAALGRTAITSLPFFYRFPEFAFAHIKPHGLQAKCGAGQDKPCPKYVDRWGTISGGIAGPHCKTSLLSAGMLARSGHPNASLAKGLYSSLPGACSSTTSRYGGRWSNWVLFHFIFGSAEVQAKYPTDVGMTLDNRFGLGQFVFRSGWNADSSHVVFNGREHIMYGHHSPEYGTFSLHKFGNLIVQAANGKSGEGAFSGVPESAPATGMVFKNMLTLHKGPSDPGLGLVGAGEVDALFGARGIRSVSKGGTIKGALIAHPGFAYVGYENHSRWNPSVVTVSEREFVYLRGATNSEYLLIFDRMNAISPDTDEKVWRIWVPTQPEFVGANPATPRPGKWTSAATDTVRVTNEQPRLVGEDYESAPTHGRFFMKTLAPASPVISFIGGPGMEFQSGDDDGSTPWGRPNLSNAAREYLGWGRLEVRPSVARNYDVFLNVIQFGDSQTMNVMNPTMRLPSSDGRMMGAHIGDPSNEWIVLFSRDAPDSFRIDDVRYSYSPQATSSKHLLLNLRRGARYYVSSTATEAATAVTVSSTETAGAIAMNSDASGAVHYSLSGQEIVALTPPVSPRNVRHAVE